MPLKYDTIFSCFHCLLFTWQPLRLEVFLKARRFLFVKIMDQRTCIKFCVKNEIKCNKVCDMLIKAYGDSTMSKPRIYEWYKRFSEGRESVEDDDRSGRPNTSINEDQIEKVKQMILENRRITIREVSDEIGISFGSCQAIFSDVLWQNNSWKLHHDNAPAHNSLLVREFLAKNNTVVLPQAPYSPDMAPSDFFLFPRLKKTLKGERFDTIDEIKKESLKELRAVSKSEFEKCFEDWKKRWKKCIISGGDYFEGDKFDIDE